MVVPFFAVNLTQHPDNTGCCVLLSAHNKEVLHLNHKHPFPYNEKKLHFNIGRGLYAAFMTATLSASLCQPASAATVWEKANEIMRDVYILTQPDAHSYFLLDGSFPHFYYLTNDRYGEAILRLLCDTQQRRTLDAILADGLHEGIPNWRVENDAIDSEGNPVLFAYTCDFPRIRRFDTALELQGMTGTLICFDYQEKALREICGQCVMLQSIDFQQFERSVLYS